MTKGDLVRIIAETKKDTIVAATALVDLVLDTISNELVKGEKVSISGFGIFNVSSRNARDGINPKTGEKIKIAASKSAKFRPGKELRDRLNNLGGE